MECWGCCGRTVKTKIFNSFKRSKKETNHRSYSSCVANLNKARIRAKGPAVRATGLERRATKQQNRKSRKTNIEFPKYGKKLESGKSQRAGLSAVIRT